MKLQGDLTACRADLDRLARQALEIRRVHLARLAESGCIRDPARLFVERQQQIDQLEIRLLRVGSSAFDYRRSQTSRILAFLSAFRPDRLLEAKRREVALMEARLKRIVSARIEYQNDSVRRLANSIRLLGPQQTLKRGYSITLDANRNVVRSASSLKDGDLLLTRLTDGEARSVVVSGRDGDGGNR
jgi:exodeoxyribonuclease VII large subunit